MKADTPTILKEILKELKKLNSILDKRLPVPSKTLRQDEIWAINKTVDTKDKVKQEE